MPSCLTAHGDGVRTRDDRNAVEDGERISDDRGGEIGIDGEWLSVRGVGVERGCGRALMADEGAVVGSLEAEGCHLHGGEEGEHGVRPEGSEPAEILDHRTVVAVDEPGECIAREAVATEAQDILGVTCVKGSGRMLQHVDTGGTAEPGIHDPVQAQPKLGCEVNRSIGSQGERCDGEPVDVACMKPGPVHRLVGGLREQGIGRQAIVGPAEVGRLSGSRDPGPLVHDYRLRDARYSVESQVVSVTPMRRSSCLRILPVSVRGNSVT